MTELQLQHGGANLTDMNDAGSDMVPRESNYDIHIEVWAQNAPRPTSIMLTDEQIPYLIEALCQYVRKK